MTPNDQTRLDRFLVAIDAAEADIAAAPNLDLWRPVLSLNGIPILWGQVSRHPRLGDGEGNVIGFDPPGLVPIDDPEMLARLLAARVDRIRRAAKELNRA